MADVPRAPHEFVAKSESGDEAESTADGAASLSDHTASSQSDMPAIAQSQVPLTQMPEEHVTATLEAQHAAAIHAATTTPAEDVASTHVDSAEDVAALQRETTKLTTSVGTEFEVSCVV